MRDLSPEEIGAIGQKLRRFRKSKGLKQPQFAQKTGVSKSYVSQIERGVTKPSMAFLTKIKELFEDFSIDLLIYGSEEGHDEKGISGHVTAGPIVREPQVLYEEKLFDNVREILKSGNTDLVDTLRANIKAFLDLTKAATEKRRYRRIPLTIPVDIKLLDEAGMPTGVAINGNQMGFLICASHDMVTGKRINLEVSWVEETGPERFRVMGEIVWKDKPDVADTQGYRYGLKFIEVYDQGHAKLESLLHE